MCGFAGSFSLAKRTVPPDLINQMCDMIQHRGPDDSGIFIDDNIGLGFRRLSIIDLKSGHQPMTSADGRFTIVFNGEIYNYVELRENLEKLGYVFHTRSDTEVLLQSYIHYGHACLAQLNGMYAFAIWDRIERRLFIARDRLGIKPFYYFYDGARFVFGSEIKAIIADRSIPREPNYEAIADYLSFSYIVDEKTFFKNIFKLMPGHYGIISEQEGLKIEQYWDLNFSTDELLTEEEYVDRLKGLLRDAVNVHLRSDVEVGCHLSGGLDSSTVTALTSQLSARSVKSFSGKFLEDSFYDETKYAKIVAAYAHTEYLETAPSIDFFIQNLHRLIWHMDEPAVGPGIIPQFSVCQLAGKHVKVVLGGQGGDELFGGYPRYFLTYDASVKFQTSHQNEATELQRRIGKAISRKLRFLITYARQHGILYTLKKAAKKLRQNAVQIESFEDAWVSYCTSIPMSHSLILSSFREKLGDYSVRDTFLRYIRKGKSKDLINQMLYHDTKAYLPGLLQVEDRTSMAVSIESRVPLLDYRIAELAARIPSSIKVKGGEPKYIFKKAIEGIIPDQILNRKDKKGFPTPIHHWFKQKPELVERILFDTASEARGIFDLDQVRRLVNSPDDNSWMIWSLINVELWFKIFIDEDPRFVGNDGKPAEKVEYS